MFWNVYFLACFPGEYNFQMQSNLFRYFEVTHILRKRMIVKKLNNILLERKLFKKKTSHRKVGDWHGEGLIPADLIGEMNKDSNAWKS